MIDVLESMEKCGGPGGTMGPCPGGGGSLLSAPAKAAHAKSVAAEEATRKAVVSRDDEKKAKQATAAAEKGDHKTAAKLHRELFSVHSAEASTPQAMRKPDIKYRNERAANKHIDAAYEHEALATGKPRGQF